MTNKATKRALLTSIMALLLCFTMLLGTTYAWFTDSVSSANNIIAAGNLDIELYHADKGTNSADEKVTGETKLFDDVDSNLWEPGAMAWEKFTIKNEGTLALKYQFMLNALKATVVDGVSFASMLKVAVVDDTFEYTRENVEAIAADQWNDLATFAFSNDMTAGENKVFGVIIWWQPSENDNLFNMNNENKGEVVSVEVGVVLKATQMMHENDSFGNDYDADAILPWDGSADTDWYDAAKTEFVLYSAEELAGLSKLVYAGNNFSGKTVKLGADIDLAGRAWTPIGRMINTSGVGENSTFKGNFDGQDKTIYNLNVDTVDGIAGNDNNKGAGLFGAITGNISNINIEGVTIVTAHWAGAIAGNIEGSITNCSVKDVNITCLPELIGSEWDNGDKAGAIVGYATKGTITGCTVTNATITAYRDMGAIAGASYNAVSEGVVSNVTLIKDSTHDYKGTSDDTTVNEYVGTVYGGATVDATGDVTIISATTFVVTNNDELVAALASQDDYIIIDLQANVSLKYPARSAYAGAETKNVKINGNNYTLTLQQTDSDWSSIGLANAEGVLSLNKLNVVKAAHEGNQAWNNHAINFYCKTEMNDVTFENSVALSGDSNLKNVTIVDEKGDFYGLIVTAKGQTVVVDGLNIKAGRAIKVMDQYVDAPEKVVIKLSNAKFATNKKAAILVTSTAGAEIIIGKNVDISGCTADTLHEVWVDEDRKDSLALVTVVGGSKKLEGSAAVATKDALTKAIANAGAGETVAVEGDIAVGAGQLAIDKPVVVDLNGHSISADYGWGIVSLKNGASIKNGTIDVDSNVAAIRAFNVGSIENMTIHIDPKATDKVATAIAVQNGGYVGTIKNVTITGATQGIELGKGAKVDVIENVDVTAVDNGIKEGIALQINAGFVGKVVNSTFNGETYGVHLMLNGEYQVGAELENCTVTGGVAALYAHDENGISNTKNCSLTLTYDVKTTFNGAFNWDFEDECKSVVTLNKPN